MRDVRKSTVSANQVNRSRILASTAPTISIRNTNTATSTAPRLGSPSAAMAADIKRPPRSPADTISTRRRRVGIGDPSSLGIRCHASTSRSKRPIMSTPDNYIVTLDLEKRREDPDRWERQWRREQRQMFWEIINSGLGYAVVFIVYVGADLATQTAATIGRVVAAGAVWYSLLWLACRWWVGRR
jgi:hypothetical protein